MFDSTAGFPSKQQIIFHYFEQQTFWRSRKHGTIPYYTTMLMHYGTIADDNIVRANANKFLNVGVTSTLTNMEVFLLEIQYKCFKNKLHLIIAPFLIIC